MTIFADEGRDGLRASEATTHAVLVVEGDMRGGLPTRQALARLGCEVVVADSGQAAVEAVCARRFDMVFIDCPLTDMSADALTGLIRGAERERGARPVAVVGMLRNATPHAVRRCLAAGMADVLVQPFMLVDLLTLLKKWAGRAAAASTDDTPW
jgi:CheY-like chemotaxis protein